MAFNLRSKQDVRFCGNLFYMSPSTETSCSLPLAWSGRPPCHKSTAQCPFSTQPHPNPSWLLKFALGILCADLTTEPIIWPCSSTCGSGPNLMLVSCKASVLGQLCSQKAAILCHDSSQLFTTAKAALVWWVQQWAQGLECGLPGFPKPLPYLGIQWQTLTNPN